MHDIKVYTDDRDGRYRAVVEARVPATPEQVWRAVATGEGLEAWYVPAEVEPHVPGRHETRHGSSGSSIGVVTVWDPPQRIAYDEEGWRGPDIPVPTWNTEIVIEPLDEGCLVRLSSGLLSGGEGWQDEVEQAFGGWMGALLNLRTYLTHYADQPASMMLLEEELPTSDEAPDVVGDSGLQGSLGEKVSSQPPTPPVSGEVLHVTSDWVTVRTDSVPGVLELATTNRGGTTSLIVRWYLYGQDSAAERERQQPLWQEWADALVQQLRNVEAESGAAEGREDPALD